MSTLRAAVCTCVSILLAGCGTSVPTPAAPPSPVVQTPLPAVVKTEAVFTPTATVVKTEAVLSPTATAAEIEQEPLIPSSAGELLKSAVANLQKAASFQLAAHAVRAYRVIEPSGALKMVVYGEFNTEYTVMRLPTLKVHATHQDRYDPLADWTEYESYTYQENGKYFTRFIEASMDSYVQETDLQYIQPMAGDVYQTLVTYSSQAEFVAETDGVAVYVLDHPEWYRLEGAIGFADLGFLGSQENGEQLVKEYAAEQYPNVKPIRFTIYVAMDEQVITKVLVDDRDFMVSVWADVDRALIERGANPEDLTRYEVMPANGAEVLFRKYNQVQDVETP
jgi:hypothetical protein